jgi:hypothetical protein
LFPGDIGPGCLVFAGFRFRGWGLRWLVIRWKNEAPVVQNGFRSGSRAVGIAEATVPAGRWMQIHVRRHGVAKEAPADGVDLRGSQFRGHVILAKLRDLLVFLGPSEHFLPGRFPVTFALQIEALAFHTEAGGAVVAPTEGNNIQAETV